MFRVASRFAWLALVACGGTETEPEANERPVEAEEPANSEDTGFEPFVRETPWDCFGRGSDDTNGDGREDAAIYAVYDPENPDLLIHSEYDPGDNGRISSQYDQAFDDRGNRVLFELDENGDDLLDRRQEAAFDKLNQETLLELDADGNGSIDFVRRRTYEKDLVQRWEEDQDGDGTFDWIRVYFYTEGVMTSLEEDTDGDGKVDLTYTYTYDKEGRILRVEGDAGDGGELEHLTEVVYKGPNDSYSFTRDSDGDGKIDESYAYVFDKEGRVLASQSDADGDGVFEEQYSEVRWDNDDRLLGYELVAEDSNGAFFYLVETTYEKPTGPWVSTNLVEIRNEGGTLLGGSAQTWEYTCP